MGDMEFESLAELWGSYRDQVVPPGAPPVQFEETQRAFYAGAFGVLTEMLKAVDENTPDEEGERMLNAWLAEARRFVDSREQGTPPAPSADEEGRRLEAVSGVNARGEGFVQIVMEYGAKKERAVNQATPAEAREISRHIAEAAEAAETDSYIVQFFRNRMDLSTEQIGAFLMDFREFRALSGGVKNRGKEDPHWQDMMRKNAQKKGHGPIDPTRKY